MKLFSIILFIGAYLSATELREGVEVYSVEKKGRIELFAKNENLYPVTLELNVDHSNIRPTKRLPIIDVIEAQSEKKLVDLRVADDKKGWEFSTKYSYYMGSVFAKHDDNFAYRLPYKLGESFPLSQGYNGSFSHQGNVAYALDFTMPEGTEIYAARGGVVIDVEESFDEGGASLDYKDKANFVTILHNDGTFADYSHLRKNGSRVAVGQKVRTGQLIAYSGSTGYATGPHLHFNVKKAVSGGYFETIPTQFATRQGKITLVEGLEYKAH